jgi:hypothetical protein
VSKFSSAITLVDKEAVLNAPLNGLAALCCQCGSITYLKALPSRDYVDNGWLSETVAELPGLSSSRKMKCGKGVLPAFGVGFTPPSERKTRTDLRVRPHPVDTLLPLAIAPVAPLHRIRGGGQQLVVKKREGLFQRGGTEVLECLTQRSEPLEPAPQCGQFGQSGLGPTAPIE